MSTRRHHHGDDASRRYRDVGPTSIPHPSRETVGSSAIAIPESSSARGNACTTSRVRDDNAPSRTLSESRTHYDTHERVDMERDGAQPRKRSSASLTKDQGSIHTKEGEGTQTKDESRPYKEEGRYDEVRADGRDNTRVAHYPSPKENSSIHNIHRPPLAHAKDVQPIIPPSASFQHLFEAQSRELTILQHERRAALEEKKALTDALATLRQQYEERSMKLSVARHEWQAAQAQQKEIDDAYNALKQDYDEQTRKLNAVRHERQAALEQRRKAENDHTALRQKYEAQKNEYNALTNKYHSLKAVLEQRTSELQGVQKFLSTADTFSGSEVVNMLRKLNEEVQQSMTFMAEWVVENFTLETLPADHTRIEQTRTSETLGMRFMQLLGTKKHKDNPILLEMALRAYLIYELYWVASPWSIGQEEQAHNIYVDAIYQRIREAEGQAISGNWRALTRAHTLPACISNPEVAHTFDTTIASGFSDILAAAGCTASQSDTTSALWSKFGEQIHHFVSLAGQVNKIIGVGVISEDFEVMVTWPDTVFDETEMEDSYDNGDRSQGAGGREEIVLCATELGLMQRMIVGTSSGQKGKPSELVVLKPKVALVSVVDIIE